MADNEKVDGGQFAGERRLDPLERIATALEFLVSGQALGVAYLQRIAVNTTPAARPAVIGPAVSIELQIAPSGGTTAMETRRPEAGKSSSGKAKAGTAVLIVDTANEKLYVVGVDSAGAKGAQLNPGDTCVATSSDLTVGSLAQDQNGGLPFNTPDPSGNATVYSAAIVPTAPPVVGKVFTLSVVLTLAGVAQAPQTVDLQFTAGPANSIILEEA
jgi:hypothetical protein